MDISAILAGAGAIALLIGIFGGGIEAEKIKIPSLRAGIRLISALTGVILIAIAIGVSRPEWLLRLFPNPQPTETQTSPPTIAPSPTIPKQYRVLLDTYHGTELLESSHRRLLQNRGLTIELATSALTRDQLLNYDVLMIDLPRYFEGKAEFTDEEVMAITEYVSQGGGVFLIGLGWVWVENRKIEEYPLNLISNEYGIWFASDYVWNVVDDVSPTFYPPFMNTEHPITQGIRLIASPESVPSSLIVESPAVPIVWGDDKTEGGSHAKNPVVLAAASVGEGKIVCLQHGGYIQNFSNEYDDFKLLENILLWLASE
jgi:hypothetical protein